MLPDGALRAYDPRTGQHYQGVVRRRLMKGSYRQSDGRPMDTYGLSVEDHLLVEKVLVPPSSVVCSW